MMAKTLRREAWKFFFFFFDFNGMWTRDLAIPVRCSNQLSYEATDVGSWSLLSSEEFFRLLDPIEICAHHCETTWFHLISYPQCNIWCISYISFTHNYLSREVVNSEVTSSQRQWLHSSVGWSIAPVSRGRGFTSRWSPKNNFSGFSTQ